MISAYGRSRERGVRVVALAALALAVCASVAAGQGRRPVPPALAKRLAEVAEQYRTGDTIWIVASYQGPYHDVTGVFTSPVDAARSVRDSLLFGVFGPFSTFRDFGSPQMFLLEDECHSWPTSFWWCYPPLRPPKPAIPMADVDSIRVTVFEKHGGPHILTYPATGGRVVDALFFSLSAVEKFQLPYYERLFGPGLAGAIRDSIAGRVKRAAQR